VPYRLAVPDGRLWPLSIDRWGKLEVVGAGRPDFSAAPIVHASSLIRSMDMYRRRRRSDQTIGARQITANIDLLDAELKVAQTECDDIDTATAQIAAGDADAKAKFIELSERRKIAGERLSRISTALTEARSGSA
jgi:hypothetical protein